jgi:hypothetical protein
MGRSKNILKNCNFEIALRPRKCSGNKKHIISAGDRCLVFKENMRKNNYCLKCAKIIIERGISNLQEMISKI